jgi:hypothetical protein
MQSTCIRTLIGIFTHQGGTGQLYEWRSLLQRSSFRLDSKDHLMCGLNFRLIVGRIASQETNVTTLNVHESINEGKTYHFFRWAAGTLADYVFKMDSDTAICPHLVEEMILRAHKQNAEYIGWPHTHFSCGRFPHCPPRYFPRWTYMSGAFYGLRANTIRSLMSNKWVKKHTVGIEDLMVGRWVYHVRRNPRIYSVNCVYAKDKYCFVRHWQHNKRLASREWICPVNNKLRRRIR